VVAHPQRNEDDLKNAPGFKYDKANTTWVPETKIARRPLLHHESSSVANFRNTIHEQRR
jgi:hypothetical protein